MIEVPLRSWGDVWANREEVVTQIYSIPTTDQVIFHTMFEGFSLKATGILKVVDEWVVATNRDPATVTFNTPNQYEKINYKFANEINPGAHFFKDSMIKYHRNIATITSTGKLFGLFLGRYTPDRNLIARYIKDNCSQHTLMSIMSGARLAATQWWDYDIEKIGSIDNSHIRNQYIDGFNTNQSLLTFYDDFQIELVVETMTRGESFFPTEKTVRPFIGSKPFITYAPVDYLANLRALGFQTFGKLWSEEYDQYEGIARWDAMKLVITSIIEHGYDRNLALEIVQYNYNHLQKIKTNG